jgi:hypothetical protein
MGHRQKGKGKKRRKSWHRTVKQDGLYRRAARRLERSQTATTKEMR